MTKEPLNTKTEISIAVVGSGGAGVMTTGQILLSIASASGLYGLMTKSYGPQIRGGESACFLRLGEKPFEQQADQIDLLVAFDFRNVDRFQEEVFLKPDAWLLYDQSAGAPPEYFICKTALPLALKNLARKVPRGLGRENIVALGLLCHLLGIQSESARAALAAHFQHKGKTAVEGNEGSFQAGYAWARQTWEEIPFRLPLKNPAPPRWQLTGNQAIVLGSLAAGCEFYAGYPITPATDIMEALSLYLPKRDGMMIQAEDEMAAINMAIGASFGGKKAMTATSGPGFSLMAEGLGLALMTELPLVVVNVQRGGPSTGIPTKTEQSDLWAAIGSSHGDNPRVVLAPSSIQGCIEKTVKAFNIAEGYQVPVILLTDQFLGNRSQIMAPIPLESFEIETRALANNMTSTPYRRFEQSGEEVLPMALPGMAEREYTADGLEHDGRGFPDASQTMHQKQSGRRINKLRPLAAEEGWIEQCGDLDATTGLIGWGSTGGAIREAIQTASVEGLPIKGIIPHLLFPPQVDLMNPIFEGLERLYVAELSGMKQFLHHLRAFYQLPPTVISIARAGGAPFRTCELRQAIHTKHAVEKE